MGAAVAVCVAVALAVVLLDGSSQQTYGLSRKKITELAAFGVTPQQYVRARKRGEEHAAALRSAPPTDPNVVGPRLIKEEHESELLAWKQLYGRRYHAKITEEWHTHQLRETRTIISLNLALENKQKILGPAEWVINFALDRSPTPAEERLANSPNAVKPLNRVARMLEAFPQPLIDPKLPVELLAFETLSPGRHEIIVTILSASGYQPPFIVRTGKVDEALLRGRELAKAAPTGDLTLRLSKNVKFYEQVTTHGGLGPKRPSSVYRLNELFNHGPVPLNLGWRRGAKDITALLRRPVEEVIIETT